MAGVQPTWRSSDTVRERSLRRVMGWVCSRPARLFGHNPWELAVESARAAGRHRVTGIAAEMSFFAVLALVPLTVAFGAALGYLERVVGAERIIEGRDAAIVVLTALLSPELTEETVAPFVRTQLRQERGGLALGGLLLVFWLASRMFAPALHALDVAYESEQRRSTLQQRLVGLMFAVGAMAASVATLVLMIVGPLLDGGRGLAAALDLHDEAYRIAWSVGRWPVLFIILVGFLVCFYRLAPSSSHPWRTYIPGAVVALLLWVLVATGFRIYLAVGGQPGAGVPAEEELILTVGRAVGAVVATMLWVFLSSLALLLGGELNAVLARRRRPD